MSKLAKPLLFLNLCCETIFVIEQRLKATGVSADNQAKVLSEMVAYVFGGKSAASILQPDFQKETREVVVAMCNCSIMKLDGSSMDKLFDLAVMMVKYKIMCSKTLEQIVEISLLHLDQVEDIIRRHVAGGGGAAAADVASTRRQVKSMYDKLGPGELHRIRQVLLAELQGQRVKISLLLSANIQNTDATFKLPMPYSARLGVVSVYDMVSGKNESQTNLPVHDALSRPYDFYDYSAPLGSNMFAAPPQKSESKHTDAHILESSFSVAFLELIHGGGEWIKRD
ncbi:hypothetical protein VOLCADRAFT_100109 [Volvox carteri f. nagariensis]|uniref:Uncharacterized protein n=1 Tax=Volvox carteri f. nagariensis TaxID=3068 RepID=D8UJG0_VOLCA|nr:uncharacterized protein VOLCADRAFT_100109 [Volvox carteri f. nagariensis]EFJ40144.1 hypothetical protein VOLCADRAFT_100109 [Volvox carteri f. nagariensis]|eukprot:XP_002958801.1 hypothetical protein VOLCADRAFT_100109 [Volvox carteri f. nagariensis]